MARAYDSNIALGVELMDRADIPFLTVAELGELIRSGEVSPVEATEAYLHRINALNADIRAYLTVTGDLEVWPESHWPGFALREADVFKSYMAW